MIHGGVAMFVAYILMYFIAERSRIMYIFRIHYPPVSPPTTVLQVSIVTSALSKTINH